MVVDTGLIPMHHAAFNEHVVVDKVLTKPCVQAEQTSWEVFKKVSLLGRIASTQKQSNVTRASKAVALEHPTPPASRFETVALIARGGDAPGVAGAFLQAIVVNGCKVEDIAQIPMIEGQLVLSLKLAVPEQRSLQVMKKLAMCAKGNGLELDYHFPHANPAPAQATEMVVATIITTEAISPALLCDLDNVFQEQGCSVHEIEHSNDNKKENNGECNKIQFKLRCRDDNCLSNLYLGRDGSSVRSLEQVEREHGCHVCLRKWHGTSRPNAQSLVVLEMSNVLCPYDLLDEVLKEAGETLESVMTHQEKISLLKGKSTECVHKLMRRIKYTTGTQALLHSLKAMGHCVAVMTDSGLGELAHYVKHQLDVDHVICQELEIADGRFTGAYAGGISDVQFEKSDLMKLMADRADIKLRNVITVSALNEYHMLAAFGSKIVFDASQAKCSLVAVLYLLGFDGRHVTELQNCYSGARAWPRQEVAEEESAKLTTNYSVQVDARKCECGQLSRIVKPLVQSRERVSIAAVRHSSLEDGGMVAGFDLKVSGSDSEAVLKELFYGCQSEGFRVRWNALAPKISSNVVQYVVTLSQKDGIAAATLEAVMSCVVESGAHVLKMERLSKNQLSAMTLVISVPEPFDADGIYAEAGKIAEAAGADLAFQRDDVNRLTRRLVVFDMDSTLIQQEVIDELAKIAGVETQVKAITEAAMRGELDFFESLKSRVALLKGHHGEELFDQVKRRLVYTPGAKHLCNTLKAMGYKMAVISGGFLPMAQEVQRHLGLDYAFANTLEVDGAGLLTGNTLGPVVTPQRKRTLLAEIASVEGCHIQQTIAIGDGANDIPMLAAAGLGIAFCAKPKVQAAAEYRINQKDLSGALLLVDVSENTAQCLTERSSSMPM